MVEVGGWEHECCGTAYERNDLVDVPCHLYVAPDGSTHLVEAHHLNPGEIGVRGRVRDIAVVLPDGSARSILRVPSGSALRGFDDDDDGHLEDPWTEDLVICDSHEFLLTIRT